MKRNIIVSAVVLLIATVVFAFMPKDERIPEGRQEAILAQMMEMIKQGHYQPPVLNDEFSQKVYERYLERLDYEKKFLTQQDVDILAKHKNTIDDEIKSANVSLFREANGMMLRRQEQAQQLYKEILANPFDYTKDESTEVDGKKLNWSNGDAGLKDRWYKYCKYRALARYVELKDDQQKKIDTKDSTLKTILSDAQLEDSARKSVLKNIDYYFRRLNKLGETERFGIYINSITGVIDPHTEFFPPKDKDRFDEQMSGRFSGIGAVLSTRDGVCKIQQIVIGSPSWKQGKLKADDVIMKVAQGVEEPVDINGWDVEDIVEIIRGKKGTEVRLTVKHKDGSIEIIPIIRDDVQKEDTFAKSAIIPEGGKNYGYIYLPEFYNDFSTADGRKCAKDIAAEIKKLKEEKVDGIIMDLRYNGGGSLSDVVDIATMFVGKDPIVQVRSRNAEPIPMTSNRASVMYDGPLAVMINTSSASASEILAASIQDHKRGVIVGSTSFGKGTVQRVIGMDDYFPGDKNLLPFGSLKITLQKFYRANGGSTQLKGVTPDVVLPDPFDLIDNGERRDKMALAWDEIDPAIIKEFDKPVNGKKMASLSDKRIANNPYFKLIEENAKRIEKQQEESLYSLNEKKYRQQIEEAKRIAKKMEELDKEKKLLDAHNPRADMDNIVIDEVAKKKNEEWLKGLNKDAYLFETINVLKDMLAIN